MNHFRVGGCLRSSCRRSAVLDLVVGRLFSGCWRESRGLCLSGVGVRRRGSCWPRDEWPCGYGLLLRYRPRCRGNTSLSRVLGWGSGVVLRRQRQLFEGRMLCLLLNLGSLLFLNVRS